MTPPSVSDLIEQLARASRVAMAASVSRLTEAQQSLAAMRSALERGEAAGPGMHEALIRLRRELAQVMRLMRQMVDFESAAAGVPLGDLQPAGSSQGYSQGGAPVRRRPQSQWRIEA
ncbi:MAG: hypothetical protein ACRD8O_05575 [Bryobacteraceae bacterium]